MRQYGIVGLPDAVFFVALERASKGYVWRYECKACKVLADFPLDKCEQAWKRDLEIFCIEHEKCERPKGLKRSYET